jgi:hypothetical protein
LSSVKTFAWWASSQTRARKTTIAAMALAAVLVGVSGFVWASPSGQEVYHAAVKAGSKAISDVIPLKAQNTSLKEQVAELKKEVWHDEGRLKSLQSASLSHQSQSASQLANLQQQLVTAQKALSGAEHSGSGTTIAAGGKPASGAPGSSAVSATVTAPTKAELLDPSTRYYGMYTQQAPFNYATMDQTSDEVGVQPNMVGYFQGWDEPFRADAVTDAWSHNQLPLLTWESQPSDAQTNSPDQPAYSLPKILAGQFDPYIEQYAKSIVATGLPLVIRFDHEMNSTWYPWVEDDGHGNSVNGNQPGDYVKVWQHVWNIFQAAGANQYVIWDWSPNIINNLTPAHQTLAYNESLYPGDQYVDWVGLSGYLRPPYATNQAYTFDYTFTPSLNILRQITNKPIILSEVGASETGGHKVAWITSFFQALAEPQNADIIGFAWFDEAISTYIDGVLGTNDWRVDSRPDTLAAFIAGLTTPADKFTLQPPPSG